MLIFLMRVNLTALVFSTVIFLELLKILFISFCSHLVNFTNFGVLFGRRVGFCNFFCLFGALPMVYWPLWFCGVVLQLFARAGNFCRSLYFIQAVSYALSTE